MFNFNPFQKSKRRAPRETDYRPGIQVETFAHPLLVHKTKKRLTGVEAGKYHDQQAYLATKAVETITGKKRFSTSSQQGRDYTPGLAPADDYDVQYDCDYDGGQWSSLDPVMGFSQNERVGNVEWQVNLERKCRDWDRLKPALLESFVRYQEVLPEEREPVSQLTSIACGKAECYQREPYSISLVAPRAQWQQQLERCSCPLPTRLMAHGFVACTPQRPTMAFAVEYLEFFYMIWRENPQSITGWANGTWRHHKQYYPALKASHGLSHHDRNGVKALLEAEDVYRDMVYERDNQLAMILNLSELQKMALKCPCCFGPREEHELGDGEPHYIVCLDGNFGQWRPKSAGTAIYGQVPHLFMQSDELSAAESVIQQRGGETHSVKEDADCSDNWKAKKGNQANSTFDHKADTGLFGMACRHDSCLRLISLTKGERLHNALALITDMLHTVDPSCNLGVLYDIGCHLDAHMKSRPLLQEERSFGRLKMGVSIFHAYAHSWTCQMKYNPRLIPGFGFTDGEGMERIWSMLSPLIRLNKKAGALLRLKNIFFRVDYINEIHRMSLVNWLHHRYYINEQRLRDSETALRAVSEAGWEEDDLRAMWEEQQLAQSAEGEKQSRDELGEKMKELLKLMSDKEMRERAQENLAAHMKVDQARRDANEARRKAHQEAGQDGGEDSEDDMHDAHRELYEATLIALSHDQKMKSGLNKIVASLRESVGNADMSAEHFMSLAQLHQAHRDLHAKVVAFRMAAEPGNQTRLGRLHSLGVKDHTKFQKKLVRVKAIVDKAIEVYNTVLEKHQTEHKSQLLRKAVDSFKMLVDLPETDMFWSGILFAEPDRPWATSSHCQEGIRALRMQDRALEERRRLDAEVAHLARWCCWYSQLLIGKLEAVSKEAEAEAEAEASVSQHESIDEEADVSSTQSEGQSVPSLPASIRYRILWIEGARVQEYVDTWIGDGLCTLWTRYAKPGFVKRKVADIEYIDSYLLGEQDKRNREMGLVVDRGTAVETAVDGQAQDVLDPDKDSHNQQAARQATTTIYDRVINGLADNLYAELDLEEGKEEEEDDEY
ncbi:hypothetical protein B9479_003989 [Cryptococcus floricola]|uniref:CxC1-like cysteine cluster associated with KDZ transposases domain-containing protein n=1 Tax=Cryptococcus floricola TaxID=2591691 RepID=A0A5D3AXY3_9TREE|nr:hypothetical protein B9479_003989 [Cryptococcus floricola]